MSAYSGWTIRTVSPSMTCSIVTRERAMLPKKSRCQPVAGTTFPSTTLAGTYGLSVAGTFALRSRYHERNVLSFPGRFFKVTWNVANDFPTWAHLTLSAAFQLRMRNGQPGPLGNFSNVTLGFPFSMTGFPSTRTLTAFVAIPICNLIAVTRSASCELRLTCGERGFP